MKLEQAVDLFLSQQATVTAQAYQYVLRDMVRFVGGSRPIASISPLHIGEYSTEIQGRDYRPATINKYAKTVKTFFNWCVKNDFLAQSPARILRIRKLPTRVSREKAMTNTELEQVLLSVRHKPRDYALVMFLADTGCRAGGAANLKVEHLNLDMRIATVTEKGEKERNVAFGWMCANALRVWLLQRPPEAGEYVFSRNHKPMQSASISQIVTRACNEARVRPLGSHSLRHRKGHQLADARVAPTVAATALGHSSPVITLQYYYPADWDTAKQWLQRLSVDEAPERDHNREIIHLMKRRTSG